MYSRPQVKTTGELGLKLQSREFLCIEISKSHPPPLLTAHLQKQPRKRPSFDLFRKKVCRCSTPAHCSLSQESRYTGVPSSMGVSKAQKREEGIRQDVETISLPLSTPLSFLWKQPQSLGLGNWICWALPVSTGEQGLRHHK